MMFGVATINYGISGQALQEMSVTGRTDSVTGRLRLETLIAINKDAGCYGVTVCTGVANAECRIQKAESIDEDGKAPET
jgi:hypothetical protein